MAVKNKAEPIWVAGCMSGTSLDGVDVALVLTDGETIFEFGDSFFRPYSKAEQGILRANLGLWKASDEAVELIETAHAQALSELQGFDCIGFHGQTFAHDPRGLGTYQAGSGAVLAQIFDVPVVWDFRSNDVAMGGQGAPLAPFFHHACARYIDAQTPLVFLNLGGVGNLTWVNPAIVNPAETDAVLAFDTGPANAPINDLMQVRFGKSFDENGDLAAQGTVDIDLLNAFSRHAYFAKIPPKSLDRNDFHNVLSQVKTLSDADAAATLTAMAAASVAQGMEHCPSAPKRILVSGGGRKNAVMMAMIAAALDCPVEPIEVVDLDGDMLEAQAFAYLAVRVKRGLPTSCSSTTGVAAAVGGGQVSTPDGAKV
ncbi:MULTISPECIES: anhydro-N-acetylmuramic acid kinase [Pacificibacter]|uniref:anhydro-N-acetylmuramic acid kinase n=1 Tax=Pacificibacter TaxID=1042323 RepID=UPI001C0A015E|nr:MULTISPECIES: anhydro-N-acetylmuramic acid kinase [Pacificibacter]MBU2935617.1 anhydro-N-acetylmuramic acid kinase [Pacificibacter marinus]MDO6614113.1 anhydro-N-acetylmuramic acid kinase [Pacificibacter sp. 1_MG-2023]